MQQHLKERLLLKAIANPTALAERIYKSCSDNVDQECGTIQYLAERLASDGKLFFWWDSAVLPLVSPQ